jgi:asparagine synthase (glutamine-hydrolysing)
MSGIVGIFNRDGRPVDRELFARTLESISHRGPDGNEQWVNVNIALGHQMMWTTPEAHYETQPLLDENKHFCLVMDGRVDNRTEVKKALADAGFPVRKDTDADIMLRAYECWGESFPFRIVGDFAVAIWDARKRQLFCTRDVFGVKPFYYGLHGNSFIFSSEVRSFFADPSFPCEPNEGFVGELLANAITSKEETLYQQMFRLPPAHSMTVDGNGIKKQRYWDFDPKKEVRYRNDAEYAEQFLELFTEVLTQQMRSDRPVGADLSGGLDSSSIVCLARALIKKGTIPENGFQTFSLVYPGLKCDESKFIKDVISKWAVKSSLIEPSQDVSCYEQSVEDSYYCPSAPNFHMMDSMKGLAKERGIRVMLNGIGGDEFLRGTPYYCADLLKRGRIFSLLKQASGYHHIYPQTHPILRFGISPLLRQILPLWGLNILRKTRNRNKDLYKPLNKDFTKRVDLSERLRVSKPNHALSFAQSYMYEVVRDGWFSYRFEIENQDSAMFGIEYRHPLHDRRLAEYLFAIPEEQRWRGTETKFILRQAMRNLLPESVRLRLDKAEFSHVFPQAYLSINAEKIFDSLTISNRGWIDFKESKEMYLEMISSYKEGRPYSIWNIWMIFSIELWARKIFSKREDYLPTKQNRLLVS